jgi:methionyl-tRNA formyltransferase
MRIVFIGTVDFSYFCLAEVIKNGGNVVGVFNQKHEHARFNSDWTDLEPLAAAAGIPLHRFTKIKDPATITQVRTLRPDVIFAWGLSQLIPEELLSIPQQGCIGVHPALLPRNRGRHPIIWALVEGLTESGLTFFYMDEGADSGDILWQRPFAITLDDDAGTLYAKLKLLAAEAIAEFLPQLRNGTALRIPQDHSKATYWRKRGEIDGIVLWNASSMHVHNLVRALTHPYPGAHTLLNGRKVTIWRSRLVDAMPPEFVPELPGSILGLSSQSMLVRSGDGFLEITEWETEDGLTLRPGVRFDAGPQALTGV